MRPVVPVQISRANIVMLVCVISLALAGAARADRHDKRVSLGLTRATGAEACITARELAQRVEGRLGRPTFASAAQADLFVDVRIANAAGWHAVVTATHANGDKAGVRQLATGRADCRALDDDLVLVVALAIDPLADTRPPPSPPSPPPVHVPGPSPRWAFEARASAIVAGSLQPTLSPALDVAIGATPPGAWPIELGAIVSRASDAETSGHGAQVRLALGTLATCPGVVDHGRASLSLCAGGAIGALLVRARGLDPASDHDLFAALAIARARVRVRLTSQLELVAGLGSAAVLTTHRLTYTALDTTTLQLIRHDVYVEPRVGWLVDFGLAGHFP